jgi:hypothetical protein
MVDLLETNAEKQAEKAEEFPAFSGIKLLHIRRQITELLGLIGRGEIFDEYTRHDISHINKMLGMLEWLIPNDTRSIMSPADWLTTVLAIYFHDIGMLVTKHEYANRNSSGFPEYRDKNLFGGKTGTDYREKLKELSDDEAERFLYQEFVRHKHAERVRNWIMGHAPEHLGITDPVMCQIDNLLKPLDSQFRKDLALVCESHHLDDLNNFKKYVVSQPYGDSEQETVNLQYCAILMRTTDLLHMTSDRTPSVVFQTINPTDPLSQREWAKQMAVKRVRAKKGLNRDNQLDDDAPKDTIEIFANFNDKSGFFGLTSFLIFVENQLQLSYTWVKEANQSQAAKHQFPWRFINDDNIKTEGFIPSTFEFTFDQAKILDLLTGHTLYNDTKVVLRELVQNSIDAIRVQHLLDEHNKNPKLPGKVEIHWDNQKRILSVKDNGTGMTQNIIERHLLRVGSSRYQDQEFKREYPNFSPISRFGIGLLSTFMIADEVEILTSHPDEEQARLLSLRSVHGKYLIQLLDKQINETAKQLNPHGTLIKLRVRPSAKIGDVLEVAQRWIVLPGCEVTVSVDENPSEKVGFGSPKEAITAYLQRIGISIESESSISSSSRKKVRIDEQEVNGIKIAYALEWSNYFHEWSFLTAPRYRRVEIDDNDVASPLLGTCIEGIRVEFGTPGFRGLGIIALANATGSTAPKTDVARSGFEATPERDAMLKVIYSVYCNHIKNELKELHEKRQFSLTWATQEARYLLRHLLGSGRGESSEIRALEPDLLNRAVHEIPILLLEHNNKRQVISPASFSNEDKFWTSDCQLFRSAEMLIREVPNQISVASLITTLYSEEFQFPNEPLLTDVDFYDAFYSRLFEKREVDAIKVYQQQRRVDVRWRVLEENSCWYIFPKKIQSIINQLNLNNHDPRLRRRVRSQELLVGINNIEITGITDEIAIRAFGITYLLTGTPIALYLGAWLRDIIINLEDELLLGTIIALQFMLINSLFDNDIQNDFKLEDLFQYLLNSSRDHPSFINRNQKIVEENILTNKFYAIVAETQWKVFDPSAWSRNDYFIL